MHRPDCPGGNLEGLLANPALALLGDDDENVAEIAAANPTLPAGVLALLAERAWERLGVQD